MHLVQLNCLWYFDYLTSLKIKLIFAVCAADPIKLLMHFIRLEQNNVVWAFELHRQFWIDSAICLLSRDLLVWLFSHFNQLH